jgi:gamma-glutamyltranspeptidase/glutathione hydrolase
LPLAVRRAELEALGHRVRVTSLTSGLHGIARDGNGWRGGADPRLEGIARGD